MARRRSPFLTVIACFYVAAFALVFVGSVWMMAYMSTIGFAPTPHSTSEGYQPGFLERIVVFCDQSLWLIVGFSVGLSLTGFIASIGLLVRLTWARRLFAAVIAVAALKKMLFAVIITGITSEGLRSRDASSFMLLGGLILLYLLVLFSFNIYVVIKVRSKSFDWEFSSGHERMRMA